MASNSLTHRISWAIVKLVVCGSSILLVGWAILVFEGSEVDPANADIVSLSPVPLSNTARFENSLDDLGHSEPRIYDYNGNEVAFSTKYTDKKSGRLIEEYQRAFVRHGLNEESYYRTVDRNAPDAEQKVAEQQRKQRAAMLSGQPVPLAIGESYSVMGAALVAGKPDTRSELKGRLANPSTDKLQNFYQGFRLIEIFRDPSSGTASVTAAWSRGSFDLNKHEPRQRVSQSNSDPVPSCPGCKQVMAFSGQANAAPNTVNVFGTNLAENKALEFYDRKMDQQGWERSSGGQMLDRFMSQMKGAGASPTLRRYKRGAQNVTVGVRPHPTLDKTMITTYQSPK
jgi:hypothetical protein